jgi:hypothetical protein
MVTPPLTEEVAWERESIEREIVAGEAEDVSVNPF